MNNQKIIPHERNRYFYGKLLTVRDFEMEQKYVNDKRRTINRLLNGPGILAGLSTIVVDDKTILVESGIAIDYLGREIVCESPFTSRLSVIEGFDSLDEYGDAYLSISYNELYKEPVHNISQNENEYNRVTESFKLELQKEAPRLENSLLNLIALKQYTLLENANFRILLKLDCVASNTEGFKAYLVVEKRKASKPILLSISLNSQYINYGQPINIAIDESKMKTSDYYSFEYTFAISDVEPQDDLVTLGKFSLTSEEYNIDHLDVVIKHVVQLDKIPKIELIENKYRKASLDDLMAASARDVICIAKLRVLKTKQTYVIENVESDPFNQLILNLQLQKIMAMYSEGDATVSSPASEASVDISHNQAYKKDLNVTTGSYKYTFNEKVNAKEKFFSEELDHGLGTGEVFIELGIDSETKDGDASFGYQSQMAFGNYEIFEKTNYEPVMPVVKAAAINYKNKGRFIIGIQFAENYSREELVVNWKATQVNEQTESLIDSKNLLIIEPAMSKVKIQTKISFNVFKNGKQVKCKWRIKEENGGEIDSNGVYMSPSVEGVYEIIAELLDYKEAISAYVVVEND